MVTNPFVPIKDKPKVVETDYHKDGDKYIITYAEIDKVKMTGEKDTDFVVLTEVKEVDRTDRQAYLDSQSNDVGILNIIEKVRLSGDITLLNQTGRVPLAAVEKDALGHDVEPVVDITAYQVDKVEALESYKFGAAAFESLDPELKKKMTFEQVAKMSDAEIDAFLKARQEALLAASKKGDE